jgi:hypothetical protein
MTFHRDLLDQATMLANKERRRPKQASLRRAVSTAYYAIFHMIIDEASNTLTTSLPNGLRLAIKRSFVHSQLKMTCKTFIEADIVKARNAAAKTKLPTAIEQNTIFPLEPNLVTVLNAFVALQEARHEADYDLSSQWVRLNVLTHVNNVENAFAAWQAVRKTPNAAVFMSTLILRNDWRQ